jgi:hypothetical protein
MTLSSPSELPFEELDDLPLEELDELPLEESSGDSRRAGAAHA